METTTQPCDARHYAALESMYRAAPINATYRPQMTVSDRRAEIEIELKPSYFHSAGAVHGAVYFKMLDDAAFFAANSVVPDVFVLTTSFVTYLTRPVSEGRMRAVGQVVNQNRSQIIAESIAYNGEGREIARGNGVFVRSAMVLADALGYSEEVQAD